MMLQRTMFEKEKIDLSSAPWTMHEFFAGSGLVAYGLKGMFAPIWANDISEQKAAVYEANFGDEHFDLADIKDIKGGDLPFAHLSWASFPCQDLSLAGSIGGIHASRSGLVWEWLRVLDEMDEKPKILLLENVSGLLSTNGGDNYRAIHMALIERGFDCGAIVLNASHFVPQSRPRVFMIAVRQDCKIPSELIGDGPTDRNGDFVINSTIIHCTTMPGALLIEKCKANLRSGCHPVIITIFDRVHTALNLAEDAGLAGRVEVWDVQQFLSANVYAVSYTHLTLPTN